MDLQILQWNCRSIRRNKHDISYLINQYKPAIFAVSETWLAPHSLFRIAGFSCLRDDRADGRAGCALLINRNIPFSQIPLPPHQTNLHVVAVRAINVSFVSVYIPHPDPNIISDLDSILSSVPSPLIVMGDFNCRHSLWGSISNDLCSSSLLDLLDNMNLCVLNNGSATRRVSPSQNISVPDLSLASPSLFSLLEWTVLPNSLGSDHFPIQISYLQSISPMTPLQPLLKYRVCEADWEKYSSQLDLSISAYPLVDPSNFLELYDSLVSSILIAANASIPLKKSSCKMKSSPPWWDSECTESVRRRRIAEDKFAASLDMTDYLSYKKVAAQTTRLLATKKKNKGGNIFANPYHLSHLFLLFGRKSRHIVEALVITA